MKKVALSGKRGTGKFALVDDGDYEEINKYYWQLNKSGYAVRWAWDKALKKGRQQTMHREINKTPKDKQTDHINGDRLDNRRSNLRTCSMKENKRNRKPGGSNKSGFKGVTMNHNKNWRAYIYLNKKHKHLGVFDKKEDAARAYNEAAKKYFKEFAYLNPT